MDHPRPPVLLAWLHDREREIVALLERLVVTESPSLDAAAQRGPFSALAEELTQLDYVVRRVRGAGVGDHLYARPRAR
ncbi:MAG: hypothetical protein ACXVRV_12755, partial [Gaiellaceae bacterium]